MTVFAITMRAKEFSDLRRKRLALAKFGKGRRRIVGRNKMQGLAIPTENIAEVSVTDPHSILQHGCKDRLKITRRAD